MNPEGRQLPERHQLPLNVSEAELLAESGESDVWKVAVKGPEAQQERKIVLKQNRETSFASDEEMQRSKNYYEYLKHFPGFGKFIPETLYFKARMEEGGLIQSFCIQHLLPGKTINRLSDAEIEQNPEVVRELLEFIDATIAILHATRKEWRVKPDFGKSPDDDERGTYMANSMLNPRYSNNIFITEAPDENGRRVFFIDTGENVAERTRMVWRIIQREVVGRRQESRLEEWKQKLEGGLQQKI
ncbi:MAG: hypothetical protein KGH56_01960 [Patescibacteria group bacterium]|nr:hypothetical protein [Patescibacteria group bacterium]